jgi:hypothetical protein
MRYRTWHIEHLADPLIGTGVTRVVTDWPASISIVRRQARCTRSGLAIGWSAQKEKVVMPSAKRIGLGCGRQSTEIVSGACSSAVKASVQPAASSWREA